ncbi:TetR/AcrR family transcriptional regulator C-terminal domain-containing protein [Streptomyces sp. NPDC047022]|uniref:TetR/AcrR family transcriptional regulator C-terminal domain-containing protein n=1 Tax=Streptomyces sp. NPDC047022 TaxID=3155737 RepID=UPI00340B3567
MHGRQDGGCLPAHLGAEEIVDAGGQVRAVAARQFLGFVQEFVIWPQVMAIGPDVMKLPPADLVVEEAIAMFLSRYATSGAHDSAAA